MSSYFISDLHLHESRPHLTERFFRFLKNEAREAKALYILGDFFEVWIGDDHISEHDQAVIDAVAEYANKGHQVYFMPGNRDFLIGKRFAEEANCTLLPDPSVIEIEGEKVLLMHGDSLCTLDAGYQRYRRWARHPWVHKIFHFLPLEWRQKIAKALRNKSMSQKLPEKGSERQRVLARWDVTLNAVHQALRVHRVRCLIHGHTHKPGIHEFILDGHRSKRIVLGDWGPSISALFYHQGIQKLITL